MTVRELFIFEALWRGISVLNETKVYVDSMSCLNFRLQLAKLEFGKVGLHGLSQPLGRVSVENEFCMKTICLCSLLRNIENAITTVTANVRCIPIFIRTAPSDFCFPVSIVISGITTSGLVISACLTLHVLSDCIDERVNLCLVSHCAGCGKEWLTRLKG